MIRPFEHELLPEVQDLIAETQRVTRRPLTLRLNLEIAVDARITFARGGAPADLIDLSPGAPSFDFAVAQQCLHILRHMRLAPGQRMAFDVRPEWTAQWALQGVPEMVSSGSLVHLRSTPINLILERHILRHFSADLAGEMRVAVDHELQKMIDFLDRIDTLPWPRELMMFHLAVNSAYVQFWFETDPRHIVRRTHRRHIDMVGDLAPLLIQRWREVCRSENVTDAEIVDAWGEAFGVRDAYVWIRDST